MRPEPPLEFHPSSLADLPLDLLVDRIDRTLGDDRGFLVTLEDVGHGLRFGFRELDDHPVDLLVGHRAPADVDAMGVVVSGTARSLDPAAGPAGVPEGRVRIVQLHARDGRSASRLRSIGTDPPLVVDAVAAEGDVADCLRRALDLPTAPPPQPPVAWWAVAWLDALLEAACGAPARRWTWADVAALHPRSCSPPPGSAAALVACIAADPARADWTALRHAVADGRTAAGPIGPELAAWMDDGMFARWLLASGPDPVDVVTDLVDLLPPALTRDVVEALRAWGCW